MHLCLPVGMEIVPYMCGGHKITSGITPCHPHCLTQSLLVLAAVYAGLADQQASGDHLSSYCLAVGTIVTNPTQIFILA